MDTLTPWKLVRRSCILGVVLCVGSVGATWAQQNKVNRKEIYRNAKTGHSTIALRQSIRASSANRPSSVTEVLALMAPEPLRQMLEPGPGFSAHQGRDPLDWRLTSAERLGENSWSFSYRSLQGLVAQCSVRLDPAFGVAVYRVTLANSSGVPSKPFTTLHSMSLGLNHIEGPRVFSCSGASSTSDYWHWGGVREYPPIPFRTRTIIPFYPRPVEFFSGGGGDRRTGSSNQDLPIIMLSPSVKWNGPGMFFGLEWVTPKQRKTCCPRQTQQRTLV
jgi:hypothetical protein